MVSKAESAGGMGYCVCGCVRVCASRCFSTTKTKKSAHSLKCSTSIRRRQTSNTLVSFSAGLPNRPTGPWPLGPAF